IAEKTKGMTKMDGYLPIYKDDQNGKLYLEINKLDQELLYVMSLPSGLGSNDIGLDRGLLGGGRIVKFTKVGKKVMMTEPNYSYRANSTSAKERETV
ncbi:MAG: peptidase, partial [bacterium]